jgi:RAB protein geranylgeranyltransferase component A
MVTNFTSYLITYIDIYISMVSSTHAVCAKGLYIAMISTTVETSTPEAEIQPALDLLGPILEMFVQINVLYEPTDNGKAHNVSIVFVFRNIYLIYRNDSCSSPRATMPLLTSRVLVMKSLIFMKGSLERN